MNVWNFMTPSALIHYYLFFIDPSSSTRTSYMEAPIYQVSPVGLSQSVGRDVVHKCCSVRPSPTSDHQHPSVLFVHSSLSLSLSQLSLSVLQIKRGKIALCARTIPFTSVRQCVIRPSPRFAFAWAASEQASKSGWKTHTHTHT